MINWFLNLFSDENCVKIILPLGTLTVFLIAMAWAVKRIYLMPPGYGAVVSGGPPPLVYQFQQIDINPLAVLLCLLLPVLMTVFVFFAAGVDN